MIITLERLFAAVRVSQGLVKVSWALYTTPIPPSFSMMPDEGVGLRHGAAILGSDLKQVNKQEPVDFVGRIRLRPQNLPPR